MVAAAGLMAAGFALQAYGQYQSGQKRARALRYEAQIAQRNAQAARKQAFDEAQQQQIQATKVIGEAKAGYAAAGVKGGSVDAVMRESAINAEFDRLNILFGGDVRAADFMSESQQKRMAATDIERASLLDVLSTGFMAAGSAVDKMPAGSGKQTGHFGGTYGANGNYAGGATRFKYESRYFGSYE